MGSCGLDHRLSEACQQESCGGQFQGSWQTIGVGFMNTPQKASQIYTLPTSLGGMAILLME